MAPTVVYEDDQGSMIDHPDDDYLEIRWYDASSEFTGDTFNRRQEVIASQHHPAFQHGRDKEAGPHRARRISAH